MRYDGYFRLAHELGKHLHEVMGWEGPMTGRQYRSWNYWLSYIDINRPDKNQFYLMQVSAEVRRVLAEKPNEVQVEDFRMTFKTPTSQEEDTTSTSQETVESASAFAKSKWIAAFGKTKIKGLNDGTNPDFRTTIGDQPYGED